MDDFNDRSSTTALLATRRSGKARDMGAPGPDAAQLAAIIAAAARVPDHGKLHPWRFVVVDDRDALAALLLDAYRAERPEAGRLEVDAVAQFARFAPTLVVAIHTPRDSHIPAWEQQLSMGAACQNLLIAAHAMGFVGNWLTGWAAYSPAVLAGLGGAAPERIAGFFFIGSQQKPLEERPRPAPASVMQRWPG
jgi:nitroreductase